MSRVPTNVSILHSIPSGESVDIRGMDQSFRDSMRVRVEVRFASALLPTIGKVTLSRITYPRRTGQSVIETTIDEPSDAVLIGEAITAFNANRRAIGELYLQGMNGLRITNNLDVDITNVSIESMVIADDVQQNPTARDRGCRS